MKKYKSKFEESKLKEEFVELSEFEDLDHEIMRLSSRANSMYLDWKIHSKDIDDWNEYGYSSFIEAKKAVVDEIFEYIHTQIDSKRKFFKI